VAEGFFLKQVILIHAHKDLQQLNALVDQLADEDFLIYVNIDRKSAIEVGSLHPAAQLVRQRIAIHWGDFSQVQATLNSLAEIVAAVPVFDKVLFVSAQDFPLLSNAQLKRELAKVAGQELLDHVPVGPEGWNCAHRYHYFYADGANPAAALACRLASRTMRALGLKRRMVNGYLPYGGSSWWALSRDCVRAILDLVAADPRVTRFFRTVSCPDELFFQTVVMNSRFGPKALSNNFRYIQWPESGARNPQVLAEGDFDRIRESGAHFCRKIDSAASAGLLPLLMRLKDGQGAQL